MKKCLTVSHCLNSLSCEQQIELPQGQSYSDTVVWLDHSGSETSPRQNDATSQEELVDEELMYKGPPLDMRDAVIKRFNRRIKELLCNGVSLQERDQDGRTIFHHLAQQDLDALSTWQALFYTPRKQVFDTINKIPNLKDRYRHMAKWHIAGLIRALLLQDKWGRHAANYARLISKEEEWRTLFDHRVVEDIYATVYFNYKDMYKNI